MEVYVPATNTGPSHKLPYTDKITLDPSLNLSNKNILEDLKNGTKLEKRSKELQLDSVDSSPDPKIFVHFASEAYNDNEQLKTKSTLPVGWKLLTTADNLALKGTIHGYFGAAFWHKNRRRIIIAHRGTILTNLDSLRTDWNGIVRHQYVKQINAACTFTHKIYEAVKECEKEKQTYFEIYFTGHSLGGWLAQVTTFSLKYLTLRNETFLKNPNLDGGYHSHTEVFDSPGCRDMLLKMANDFDVRYSGKNCMLDNLDITTYLSSPNAINCCNLHVGRLYRIFPEITSDQYLFYTQSSHNMNGILETFNSSDPLLIKEVVDWPKIDLDLWQWKIWIMPKTILGKEYEDFFHWAKYLNYDPKMEDDLEFKVAAYTVNENKCFEEKFVTIRYQIKPTRRNECSFSVFTESQLKFLRKFQLLRILPNSVFHEDNITNNQSNKIKNKLAQLILYDDYVSCDKNANIRQLVAYVKTLLRLYPNVNEEVDMALTDFTIRKQIYKDITDKYLRKMNELTQILLQPDWSELDNFLENDFNQVSIILAESRTEFAVAKALKTILRKVDNEIFAFELQSLRTIESFFSLTNFLSSDKLNHILILLECKSGSFSSSENVLLLQDIITCIRNGLNLKLILIIDKKESETIDGNDSIILAHEGISWNELTNETQTQILSNELIIFQGNSRKISLEQLLRLPSKDMDSTQLEDVFGTEALEKFIQGHDVIVGKDITILGEIYISRNIMYKPFIKDDIFKVLNRDYLVAFSGINPKDIDKQIESRNVTKLLDGIKNGNFQIIESEEDFEELCVMNPNKYVYWLKYESNGFVFQKSRGNLYLLRNLLDHDRVVNYSEETLLESLNDRKTLIISDTPGMGKSTVLSSLARKIKDIFPNQWVVRVNLNLCTEALRTANKNGLQIKNILDATNFLVEKILSFDSDFEKKLFKKALITYGGVVLIFDGYDEISPVYGEIVAGLLEFLQKTKFEKMFVTTRQHTQEQLEDRLGIFSHAMVPFTEENQKEYLIEIWKKRLDDTNSIEDLEKYAKETLCLFEESVKDHENTFLGTPLLCMLLAEYMIQQFLNGEHQELKVISLMNMFETFARKKLRIYKERNLNTKGNPAAENNSKIMNNLIIKLHRQFALKLILSEEVWEELNYPQVEDELQEIIENEVLRVGLMTNTSRNSPQFQHRTFAEFYVLDYALNLDQDKNREKFTILSREFLLKKELRVIRTFLECMIGVENRTAEVDKILFSFVEFWTRNWLFNRCNCLNDDGETVLHRLLEEQHLATFARILFLLTKHRSVEIRSLLSVATINGTALHIAVRKGNTDIVRLLLQCNPDLKWTDKYGWTPIHVAAKNGDYEIMSLLIESITVNRDEYEDLINERNRFGETALQIACRHGHTRIVRLLLENGSDVDAREQNQSTPLISASSRGHLDIVRILIDNGADINPIGAMRGNPLIKASSAGHLEVVRLLIENGADLNAVDKFGNTPLIEASYKGHLEITRLLVDKFADINVRNKYGSTPLIEASSAGRLEVVRFLLENGADINANDYDGYTSLIEAASKGHLGIVRYLLENGGDINVKDNDGSTALIKASTYGHSEVVKLLLDEGGDINALDIFGSTSLIKAASNGHLETVNILLDNNGDINARDKHGSTPLIKASSKGKLEIVRLLLEKGADINARNNDGSNPLIVASSEISRDMLRFLDERRDHYNGRNNEVEASDKGQYETVRFLVKMGADINTSNIHGFTPLHVASIAGYKRMAEFLISKGADVNSVDKLNRTPLHVASANGKTDLVLILLQNEANINSLARDKNTPLHVAIRKGNLETVRVLLEHGANPKAKNGDKPSPLEVAIKRNQTKLIELLAQYN